VSVALALSLLAVVASELLACRLTARWPAEHVNCPDAQGYIGLSSSDGAIFESNTVDNGYLHGHNGQNNIVVGAPRTRAAQLA
jgi:hypothetical protein